MQDVKKGGEKQKIIQKISNIFPAKTEFVSFIGFLLQKLRENFYYYKS